MDRVERSQNRAPDTVTEMNFGLRFADLMIAPVR